LAWSFAAQRQYWASDSATRIISTTISAANHHITHIKLWDVSNVNEASK
jgi:hypothetical protein